MLENSSSVTETLPLISDKELFAMNQLMTDKRYRIKLPTNFLHSDRSDKINPDFILYTLNDYVGHLQKCVASTKRMLPPSENAAFYEKLAQYDNVAFKLMSIVQAIDVKQLSAILTILQKQTRDVSVSQMIPFIQLLFQSLIRVYYLGSSGVAKKYRVVYSLVIKELVPVDADNFKSYTTSAIEEWYYLFDQTCTGLYPLVLRMCSPVMLSQDQLFYKNGSRVLSWLHVKPTDVLILNEKEEEKKESAADLVPEPPEKEEEKKALPPEVIEGLQILERLFPEAGWDKLETLPDLCPYFQPILQFNDSFTQLAPDNPLQQTLILLWILEELFQGLRLIKFVSLQPLSPLDETEEINKILEDWILYQETIFEKNFSTDLKEYTHQLYTQPEYNKSPYGRTLLSNMYTLIKTTFLPYFDIRLYGTAKYQKDDRLPPFFLRVGRLKRLLSRYNASIEAAPVGSEVLSSSSVLGIQNPWAQYKFDIPNPVSRRLDAICGGKNSKIRTNALLIRYTLSILNVLDWWVNDKESYAYTNTPDYLYRVAIPGSSVPSFGIKLRTDVETIFNRHLRARSQGSSSLEN